MVSCARIINNFQNASVDESEKEDFNFPLPEEEMRVEHIPLPQKLLDHRVLPPDNNGLLGGVGDVNVGFGLGVGVPGASDGVSVGSRVIKSELNHLL